MGYSESFGHIPSNRVTALASIAQSKKQITYFSPGDKEQIVIVALDEEEAGK
jgi:hypothetical protein